MQILDQVTKNHVPIELVKEIQFIHQGEINMRLNLEDLDSETIMNFGRWLYEKQSDDVQIKLMVDIDLLKETVSKVVEPILKNLPRKI